MCTARCQAMLEEAMLEEAMLEEAMLEQSTVGSAIRASRSTLPPPMPSRRPSRAASAADRQPTRLSTPVPQFTHVIDLTHILRQDFPTFDGPPTFDLQQTSWFEKSRFNVNRWTLDEHTGTHFDAPLHCANGAASVEMVPITELIAPLAVLDVTEQAARDPDYAITPDDVATYERQFGPLPDGGCVAFNSGWDAHVLSDKFRNADRQGVMHFPGLHAETGALLLERNLVGVACDTLSFDCGNTTEFPVHMQWLPAGRWGLECVANLGLLPQAGATIIVGVPRVLGATGAPARVMALI